MILLKFLVFLLSGEGTALTRRSKLWLAASCRHDALQAKKRDIFPAGKVWFLPPRPRRYFPHGNSRRESRYLAQKRDKYFDAISRQIFLPFGFLYGSKNWLAKIFGFSEQPYNSVRTSLVRCSICLWEFRACGASKTLRCKHCGVAPTPTGLCKFFLHFPAAHRLDKLFL